MPIIPIPLHGRFGRSEPLIKYAPPGSPSSGQGVTGQNGPAPDPNGYAPGTPHQALMDSYSSFCSPSLNDDDAAPLVAVMTMKMSKVQEQTSEEQIKGDTNQQRSCLEKKEKMLKDAIQKQQAAMHPSFLDILKNIGEYVAIACTYLCSAALSVVGVGAVLATIITVILVVGAIATAASAVNDSIKLATGGTGLLGEIVKIFTNDPTAIQNADQVFGYVTLAAAVLSAIVTIWCNPSGAAIISGQVAKIMQLTTALVNAAISAVIGGIDFSADLTHQQGQKEQALAYQLDEVIKELANDISHQADFVYKRMDDARNSVMQAATDATNNHMQVLARGILG